jgi:hypothetical protein
MRQLKSYEANQKLTITVTDKSGAGGMNHRYDITGFVARKNPSAFTSDVHTNLAVIFQNGPIEEVGVNGVTHEALLAILIDRLECLQAGEYACSENETALLHLQIARDEMHSRTVKRLKRGVESTHEK